MSRMQIGSRVLCSIMDSGDRFQIIKTEIGYLRVDPFPTQEELSNMYANKYYQNPHGTYSDSYSEIESTQRKLRIELIYQATISHYRICGKTSSRILDVGCGEGFLLSHFKNAGWKVLGVDFSDEGVKQHNPVLIKDVIKGDAYCELEVLLKKNKNYDVIHLGNVLEHVRDPLALVRKCSDLLSLGGVLIISVPNDFSILQKYLFTSSIVKSEYWICPPDHLNYFTLESLVKLQVTSNLEVLDQICDFPIEWFLMNNNSNYINDPTLGKSAHQARTRLDSLLNSSGDLELRLNFWRSMAALGFGRTITTFSKKIS